MAYVYKTHFETMEWGRMAQDAYRTGRNAYGNRYSSHAALPDGEPIPLAAYDVMMRTYRQWLIGGWELVENPK